MHWLEKNWISILLVRRLLQCSYSNLRSHALFAIYSTSPLRYLCGLPGCPMVLSSVFSSCVFPSSFHCPLLPYVLPSFQHAFHLIRNFLPLCSYSWRHYSSLYLLLRLCLQRKRKILVFRLRQAVHLHLPGSKQLATGFIGLLSNYKLFQGICVAVMVLADVAIVMKLYKIRKTHVISRTSIVAVSSGHRLEADGVTGTAGGSQTRRASRVC